MCGIAGAIGAIDPSVVDAVRRMHDAQKLRGPDAEGFWTSPVNEQGQGVVLAHRRLSIIDLSPASAQPMGAGGPMKLGEPGAMMVFNGEIYNFAEVRQELEACGHQFRSQGDTEVVLRAMEQWGEEAAEHFQGMFAIAYWDAQSQSLRLLRDRQGIKPLYYAHTPDGKTLLLASEFRAILASGMIPRELDPRGLQSFLWNGFVTGPRTMVNRVNLLEAGSQSVVRLDSLEVHPLRYWSLPRWGQERSPQDLKQVLQDAVSSRLVADVPLGIFLSGGIDSSALAAMAMSSREEPVHTFSIGFEEVEFDESKYAQAVAEAIGSRHENLMLTGAHFQEQLPTALASLDQPTFDGINTYFVSRAVREAGLTVALSGAGGDELFGGYSSFRDLPRASAWHRRLRAVPLKLRRQVARTLTRMKSGPAGEVGPQTRWGKMEDVFVDGQSLATLFQISAGLYTRSFLAELAPGAEGSFGFSEGFPLENLEQGTTMLQAISLMELSQFVGQRLLRDTDAASMASSLEVRVPFLDHRVIECLAGMDDDTRFAPLGRKQLLRDLTLDQLDPALFERPKSGFVLPIDRWCREGLQKQVEERLLDQEACRSIGINPDAVARLWRAYHANAPGIYWSRVWSLFVLLDWCQRHGIQRAA